MTLCAGIHPNRTLPVVLDCGTDNKELLEDPLYLGLKRPRVRGKEYDEFVDTFVQSARKLYPRAYIHFEDFGLPNGKQCEKLCTARLIFSQLEDSLINIDHRSHASTMTYKAQGALPWLQ